MAGDEESYEVFKELFDLIISAKHGGYSPDDKHITDLEASKVSWGPYIYKVLYDSNGIKGILPRGQIGNILKNYKLNI